MPTSDAEFIAATHAELTRLVGECKAVRRNRPNHPWCSDSAGCRHCVAIRDLHLLLTDHLDQLDGISPTPVHTSVAVVFLSTGLHDPATTSAKTCGVCGRSRYTNFHGATVCLACDGHPAGHWTGADAEDAL